MHTRRFHYLLLGLVLLSGCRGGAKVLTQAEGYDFEEMRVHPWAIGGVVVKTGLDADGAAGKELQPLLQDEFGFSDACSPMLYSGILRTAPEMELWTFGTVQASVPRAQLLSLMTDIERSRQPAPALIKELIPFLPPVKYIVFGRLDDTELVTNQDISSRVVDQMNRDGREPHATTLSRTATLRRGVYMSMEIYDMKNGTLVWSGEADQWDEDLMGGDADGQMGNVQVQRQGEDPENALIQMDGTMRKGPGLLDGIRECCVRLAAKMKSEKVE